MTTKSGVVTTEAGCHNGSCCVLTRERAERHMALLSRAEYEGKLAEGELALRSFIRAKGFEGRVDVKTADVYQGRTNQQTRETLIHTTALFCPLLVTCCSHCYGKRFSVSASESRGFRQNGTLKRHLCVMHLQKKRAKENATKMASNGTSSSRRIKKRKTPATSRSASEQEEKPKVVQEGDIYVAARMFATEDARDYASLGEKQVKRTPGLSALVRQVKKASKELVLLTNEKQTAVLRARTEFSNSQDPDGDLERLVQEIEKDWDLKIKHKNLQVRAGRAGHAGGVRARAEKRSGLLCVNT